MDDGDEMELHGFEVAALMNLVATDTLVEEAVALIPSLSRFPEAATDEILNFIRTTLFESFPEIKKEGVVFSSFE